MTTQSTDTPTPTTPSTAAVVGLVGNPAPGSRTARVTTHVVETVRAALGLTAADTTVVELAEHTGDAATQATVTDARVLVVATPAYKGSYTGLLKLFLDTLAADSLTGTVVVPVVVAGSPVHATMTDLHLRWVLGEISGALPVPSVVLTERQLAEHDDVAGAVAGWVDAHLAGVVAADQASRSATTSANAPALAGSTSR